MRIEIRNDLFDIETRLREIDPSYGIVFNTESNKFEVTKEGETVLRLPFESLDERTLRHVIYTRWDNIERVTEDLDRSNEELARDRLKRAQDDLEDGFSRALRLAGV